MSPISTVWLQVLCFSKAFDNISRASSTFPPGGRYMPMIIRLVFLYFNSIAAISQNIS